MTYSPNSQGPWLKGLVASNSPLAQPKGSFPRGSNLVMVERGGLTPCDGSAIINWQSGAIQSLAGRIMAEFLFEPTGVQPYYLVVGKSPGTPFGPPEELTAVLAAGGSLNSGTQYWYVVTALDGVGGETTVSNEVSATPSGGNLSVTLTWNFIPNVFAYNVYRGTSSGIELQLTGVNLPALQSGQSGPLTATYTDNGSAVTFSNSLITSSVPGPSSGSVVFILSSPITMMLVPGQRLIASGVGNPVFDGTYILSAKAGSEELIANNPSNIAVGTVGFNGTLSSSVAPPIVDSTQQTVLYQMPTGSIPVSYGNSNIVAYFPASLQALGQVPTGATGGGGTDGPGINGQGTSTPSGGIKGLVGPLPQMKQFTNRVVIALGNGFPMQAFFDPTGTATNPAFTAAVTGVAVSGDQVTVTGAFSSLTKVVVGANVVLSGMTDSTYNGTFPVLKATTGFSFVIRNPNASGGAATGTFTVTTLPISPATSTFIPAYPVWTASTAYAVGDIIVPVTQPTPNIYVTCVQAGESGGSEPSWTAMVGQQYADNTVLWQTTALLNTAAPPPPGAGHIEVYSGALWALNTSPSNTSNGLDGPCALRQSNENDIFSWNPIYQAFLDKDDGAEGMGLGKFTITAQGIPPEGSLIAFKYRVPYQIIGVFGANNFAIQPASSDMGCLAPRSIDFVPGYGLMRYCHLGIAVFNGYKDEVVSEQVRPYLFPTNDFDASDIAVADANYLPLSWAAQTSNPPMYAFAMPVGNSGGQLTQILLFDLVLKCWAAPVELPFPIGSMAQVQPVTSNPLTLLGGFDDGCLQRWQAGDISWYTGSSSPIPVSWNMRTVTVASQQSSQRLWARKVIFRGTNTGSAGMVNVITRVSAVPKLSMNFPIAANGDFDVFVDVGITGLRFDAIISSTAHLELEGVDWAVEQRSFGVPLSAI